MIFLRRMLKLALRRSIDDAHAAAPAQFLNANHKIAVRHHIIAFGLHDDHEIAITFEVKKHFGLALVLVEKSVQGINRAIFGAAKRDANANRFR